jgi:Calcineurin-like phosphoesterase
LYNKAVEQNNHQLFHYVILVGDICNKGPQSMLVIRHMQQHEKDHWMCIRGNHENAVLRAYMEMKTWSKDDAKYKRYQWLLGEETVRHREQPHDVHSDHTDSNDTAASSNDDIMTIKKDPTQEQILQFTDEDYEWMSNLPYTIRIPANHIGLQVDTNHPNSHNRNTINNDASNDIVIVHAGLIPGLPIEENDIPTMVVLRDLSVPDEYEYDIDDKENTGTGRNPTTHTNTNHDTTSTPPKMKTVPWASVWNGPELILFGHDAKRGLQQQHPKTIGLDTGCVYGKQLTGILLPSRTIVQVPALKTHVPIVEKE